MARRISKWTPVKCRQEGCQPRARHGSPGKEILELLRPSGRGGIAKSHSAGSKSPQQMDADEFALVQMETRADAFRDADRHNLETFDCNAGPGGGAWDVEAMLDACARQGGTDHEQKHVLHVYTSELESTRFPAVHVGTCGFMDLSTSAYARRFRCVELNYTFHDGMAGKDLGSKRYKQKAQELLLLEVQVVVKVSGYATHEQKLENPEWWWPWLWERYNYFAQAGLLAGLLWQFPPSCECTEAMLQRIAALGKSIRRSGCNAPSILEFRHPSWFERADVETMCRKHRFSMAWVHFRNETGWAGQMPSGWSPRFPVQTGPVVYLRLFGSEGRNLGEYDDNFLREQVVARLPKPTGGRDARGFIFFGQSDVPTQAQANAARVTSLLAGLDAADAEVRQLQKPNPGAWLGGMPLVGDFVSGRVIRTERAQCLVDLRHGRQGILGTFYIRSTGLRLRRGDSISGLRVEGIDDMGRIWLSGRHAQLEKNSKDDVAESTDAEGGDCSSDSSSMSEPETAAGDWRGRGVKSSRGGRRGGRRGSAQVESTANKAAEGEDEDEYEDGDSIIDAKDEQRKGRGRNGGRGRGKAGSQSTQKVWKPKVAT